MLHEQAGFNPGSTIPNQNSPSAAPCLSSKTAWKDQMVSKLVGALCHMHFGMPPESLFIFLSSVPEEKRMARALWLAALSHSPESTAYLTRLYDEVVATRMEPASSTSTQIMPT